MAPVHYDIGPAAGNRLALEVYKTGLWSGKKHSFTFERYQGTLLYDPEAPERSQVRFTVDAKSIALHDAWVSENDRAKVTKYALSDMLGADRYPQLLFTSTRIVAKAPNQFEVQGTLTMRGVAKPATVTVTLKPGLSFEGSATLRMTDWGMKPPKAALGAIGTRDEMQVSFTLKPAVSY